MSGTQNDKRVIVTRDDALLQVHAPNEDDDDDQRPLLKDARSVRSTLSLEDFQHAVRTEERPGTSYRTYLVESKRLVGLAAPLVCQNSLFMAINVMNTIAVGHIGSKELAAMALATSMYNITGFSLMMGLAAGMETLSGQAFGAGNFKQVGVVLQRGLVVNLTAALLVMLAVWLPMKHALLAIGQDPVISSMAVGYLLRCCPAFACHAIDTCLIRYLVVQGVTGVTFVSAGIGCALMPLYLWLFLWCLRWGLWGSAASFNAVIATILAADVIVVVGREYLLRRQNVPHRCFHGWTFQAFQQLRGYLSYAMPSYAMLALEWWVFELGAVLCGLLPDAQVALATYGIVLQAASVAYMVPLSMMDACITRVSNLLGAQEPWAARVAARSTLGIVMTTQATFAAILLGVRQFYGRLWTDDEAVVKAVAVTSIPVALSMVPDGSCAALNAVLRASGQQVKGLTINFMTYWVFGIPLNCLLLYYFQLGPKGFWTGMATITTIQTCVLISLQLRIDWPQQAADAKSRVQRLEGAQQADEHDVLLAFPEDVASEHQGAVDVVGVGKPGVGSVREHGTACVVDVQ